MRIKTYSVIHFYVPLKMEHVDMLMGMASNHYDATCRSAAAPWTKHPELYEGLLAGWKRQLEFCDDHEMGNVTIDMTNNQIDLLQKVMEYPRGTLTNAELKAREQVQWIFAEVRRRGNELYDEWQTEIVVDLPARMK